MNSIYLLRKGASEGPYHAGEIQDLLDLKRLSGRRMAAVEGMREWRSVREALIWARGSLLTEVRDKVLEQVIELKNGRGNVATARAEIMLALPKERTEHDPKAFDSLGIILQTNADLQRNAELFEQERQAERLERWPAWELVELAKPHFPRNWTAAWKTAGGKTVQGRMIARKDDPVWLALSDFGRPFPPFSFDPRYGTQPVARADCLKLGIIARGEVPAAPPVCEAWGLAGIL